MKKTPKEICLEFVRDGYLPDQTISLVADVFEIPEKELRDDIGIRPSIRRKCGMN